MMRLFTLLKGKLRFVKQHRKVFILLVTSLVLACYFIYGIIESTKLTITIYRCSDEHITSELSICHLTDLHNHQFGNNNSQLFEYVKESEPDVIFMTGDMLSDDSNEEDASLLCSFISRCVEIAPVYYSLGNHEVEYISKNGEGFLSEIEKSGAIVLNNSYVDTKLNNQKVRIGGAYGYLLSHKYCNGDEQSFLDDFTNTELPTLLLAHISEGLLEYGCAKDWEIDYVFCGHTHGGQVKLPLIGGLFAPEVGWFPKYTDGLYEIGDSKIILSAGLGSSSCIPRLWNSPEIATLIINWGFGTYE